MTTTFRSVWQGAAFRSDLSVNGSGPHASERVTDAEWRTLLNASVVSAWRMAAAARPDFSVKSADSTITSGFSAFYPVPSDFFDLVDVVWGPDTTTEYSLGPFAWQNRRSPGGWFPANFGGSANLGGSAARLMGTNIYIEPSLRAGGIYRTWYCPMPKQIRADFTVKVATTAALPLCTAAGSGLTKTLTATSNGFLTIDTVLLTGGELVLVQNQVNQVDNGLYVVTQSSGGVPFILTRFTLQTLFTSTLGTMVQVSAGTANIDLFFETTSIATVVDSTAWTWAEAFIEPQLEQFRELLEIMTALAPVQRDNDLDPKPLLLRAYGPDGANGGLAGELKSYFRTVRTNNGPAKMVDTDARGPRAPWSL